MTTTATTAPIETFWANLTPIQRAILATAAETRFNHNLFFSELSSSSARVERIEKAAEGDHSQLTENVHKRINDFLVDQTDAPFDTVLRVLLHSKP